MTNDLLRRIYSSVLGLSRRAPLADTAQVILPRARWKRLVGGKRCQLLFAHVERLAVCHRHMRELAEEGKLNGAQDRLLEVRSDHCVAMGAQQDGRAVLQRKDECFAALDSADQSGRRINWRAVRGKELRVHVQRAKTAFEHAEKRAPLRVGVADAHHVRASFQNARVNRPFVGRRVLAAEKITVEIEQHEPVRRRTTRAHAGEREKCLSSGDAYTYMTEAVGDAFAIENVTAVDEFLLEL